MASFDRIKEAVAEGTQDGIRDTARIIQDIANRIISDEAIDTGDLLNSDELEENPDDFGVFAKWTAEHAQPVNDGQRPHWPPEEPIREWVERNLRITVSDAGDREPILKPQLSEGTESPREQELEAVTFLVRRKIAREGVDPIHFAERGAQEARKQATQNVRDAITNRLRRL
jgi:hypothetical protein